MNTCWLCSIISNGTLGCVLRDTIGRAKGEILALDVAEVRGLILRQSGVRVQC